MAIFIGRAGDFMKKKALTGRKSRRSGKLAPTDTALERTASNER